VVDFKQFGKSASQACAPRHDSDQLPERENDPNRPGSKRLCPI